MDGRIPALVRALEELAYFHRATAHVLFGWSPKLPDLHIKAACARHAFEDLDTSLKLSGHVAALMGGTGYASSVPSGWIELMKSVDRAPGPDEAVFAIYAVVRRHLLEQTREVLRNISPVLDATLLYVLPQSIELLEKQHTWAARVITGGLSAETALFTAKLEGLWPERHHGAPVPSARAIWAPLDRATRAQRPPGMRRGIPGAMRLLPLESSFDRAGIGLFLHNLVNGEYTTLELASRSMYEHPDMPPAFFQHLARQASDEARHARAIEDLAQKFGVNYGEYPIYTLTYDGYYEYIPAVEPGSKRELCWRLLVRGTIDEGLALDDFMYQARRREYLGQTELAELFRYLLADELFHARAALKWSRHLCGDDETQALAERDLANQTVSKLLDDRRREFVTAHPEEAAREMEHRRRVEESESKTPLPFERVMNLAARREAGYSDRELAQVIGWGYAMPMRFGKDSHDPDQ